MNRGKKSLTREWREEKKKKYMGKINKQSSERKICILNEHLITFSTCISLFPSIWLTKKFVASTPLLLSRYGIAIVSFSSNRFFCSHARHTSKWIFQTEAVKKNTHTHTHKPQTNVQTGYYIFERAWNLVSVMGFVYNLQQFRFPSTFPQTGASLMEIWISGY